MKGFFFSFLVFGLISAALSVFEVKHGLDNFKTAAKNGQSLGEFYKALLSELEKVQEDNNKLSTTTKNIFELYDSIKSTPSNNFRGLVNIQVKDLQDFASGSSDILENSISWINLRVRYIKDSSKEVELRNELRIAKSYIDNFSMAMTAEAMDIVKLAELEGQDTKQLDNKIEKVKQIMDVDFWTARTDTAVELLKALIEQTS